METERLWARDLGGDTYRIENIPFFARDLAFGDEVVARRNAPDEDPTFVEVARRPANPTLHFIVSNGHTTQPVVDLLESHGVGIEGMSSDKLLAVDVPREVDLRALATTVTRGERDGVWAREEGRSSPRGPTLWQRSRGQVGAPSWTRHSTRLEPTSTRLSVDGTTSRRRASPRPLRPEGARCTS